jgi:hypothetical protein
MLERAEDEQKAAAAGSSAPSVRTLSAAALAALDRARILTTQLPFFHAWLANLHSQLYLEREDSKPAWRYAEEAVLQSRALNDEWLTADSLLTDIADAIRAQAR